MIISSIFGVKEGSNGTIGITDDKTGVKRVEGKARNGIRMVKAIENIIEQVPHPHLSVDSGQQQRVVGGQQQANRTNGRGTQNNEAGGGCGVGQGGWCVFQNTDLVHCSSLSVVWRALGLAVAGCRRREIRVDQIKGIGRVLGDLQVMDSFVDRDGLQALAIQCVPNANGLIQRGRHQLQAVVGVQQQLGDAGAVAPEDADQRSFVAGACVDQILADAAHRALLAGLAAGARMGAAERPVDEARIAAEHSHAWMEGTRSQPSFDSC